MVSHSVPASSIASSIAVSVPAPQRADVGVPSRSVEPVVAGAAAHDVEARAAGQVVVAGAAVEIVVALGAVERCRCRRRR